MKKRVTIISVETERVVEIRRAGRTSHGWCERCRMQTPMLTLEELAVITGVGSGRGFGPAETGRLHFNRTPQGVLLVCLNSLEALSDGRR